MSEKLTSIGPVRILNPSDPTNLTGCCHSVRPCNKLSSIPGALVAVAVAAAELIAAALLLSAARTPALEVRPRSGPAQARV
jgi:hypothetical protein